MRNRRERAVLKARRVQPGEEMVRRPLASILSLAPALAIVLASLPATALDEAGRSSASDMAPLSVEVKIPLGDIAGRIDHLAFDPTRGRLYVAELGNNACGIIDVKTRRVVRTEKRFDEPQGIAYEPSTDTVYVANGGDGSVGLFRADNFTAIGQMALG